MESLMNKDHKTKCGDKKKNDNRKRRLNKILEKGMTE